MDILGTGCYSHSLPAEELIPFLGLPFISHSEMSSSTKSFVLRFMVKRKGWAPSEDQTPFDNCPNSDGETRPRAGKEI